MGKAISCRFLRMCKSSESSVEEFYRNHLKPELLPENIQDFLIAKNLELLSKGYLLISHSDSRDGKPASYFSAGKSIYSGAIRYR